MIRSTDGTVLESTLGDKLVAAGTGNVHAPAANTAAVLTFTAVASKSYVLRGVEWSYSAAPTNGNLKVENGASTVFSVDVTAAGPGFIPFDPPIVGSINTNMVVTLAAGSGSVVGKVNARAYTE